MTSPSPHQQEDLKRKFNTFDDDDFGLSNNKHFKFMQDCVYEDEDSDFDHDPQDLETKEAPDLTIDNYNSGQQIPLKQQEQQETSAPQQQEQPSQPQAPQRKKPGRKPNPASPALRKAQNRAAQRAFRERKERHLRELEDTIKTLRQNEYEITVKHQKESDNYREMLEALKNDSIYWKEVAQAFETVINNMNVGSDITSKIKTTLLANMSTMMLAQNQSITTGMYSLLPALQQSLSSTSTVTNEDAPLSYNPSSQQQTQRQSPSRRPQMQNDVLQVLLTLTPEQNDSCDGSVASKKFLPSPTNSSTVMSPQSTPVTPSTTVGSPPTNYEDLVNELGMNEVKPVITDTRDGGNTVAAFNSTYLENPALIDSDFSLFLNINSYLTDYQILQGQQQSLMQIQMQQNEQKSNINAISLLSAEEMQQLNDLARLVRAPNNFSDVSPRLHFPLSQEQLFYLQQSHDPRIGMIPCLHLRARMIEHRDKYDLKKLCDLLIKKAKCHGDTMDPEAWEMPEEFFEEYSFLSFHHCRVKSDFYRQNAGKASKGDLTNYVKKAGLNPYLVS
ncbi:6346_t:CDS:2 [Ambispora gerdemannii]|uniref:6346_t:CDS:1 n=1 Tax=Ambispora gerdemannii TaxID=144530 RepID=A0A9N8Z3D2_9GLOM|nr:6346_t:CDS:2 [Ambispora gerdemannii]